MIEVEFSLFRTALDNRPIVRKKRWGSILDAFQRDQEPARIPGQDLKKGLPAASGAIYQSGAIRGRANVQALQLLLADIDNSEEFPDPTGATHPSGAPVMLKRLCRDHATMEAVGQALQSAGLEAFLWSTWSHSEAWPKFRACIPLAWPTAPETWLQFTEWALQRAGLKPWAHCIDQGHLHNVAALSFLPAQRPDGPTVERLHVLGDPLEAPCVDDLKEIRLPAPAALQPHQKARLAAWGKPHQWAARFQDGKGNLLDMTQLDGLALCRALGLQPGAGRSTGSGKKYRTRCPFWQEHTTPHEDDDSGVLFVDPGRWPTWGCKHSGHAHLGIQDLMAFGGLLR